MVKNIEKRSDKAVQDAAVFSNNGTVMSSTYGTVRYPDGTHKFSNGTIVSPLGVVIKNGNAAIDEYLLNDKITPKEIMKYVRSELNQNTRKFIVTSLSISLITGFIVYYHYEIYKILISLL